MSAHIPFCFSHTTDHFIVVLPFRELHNDADVLRASRQIPQSQLTRVLLPFYLFIPLSLSLAGTLYVFLYLKQSHARIC